MEFTFDQPTISTPNSNLVYNNTLDTFTIKNVLLISSYVYESQLFYDSANSNTFPIIYYPNSDNNELILLLRNKFQNGIQRISFAFHDPLNNIKTFLDNKPFFDDNDLIENQTTFSETVTFLTNLITTGKYVDPNTGKPIKGLKEDIKKSAAVLGTLSKSAQTLKTDARSLTVQTLQSTANANGVTLSPQQLDQYALDIQNGKDIKVIQSQIRNIAGAGMPENVKKLLAEGTDLATVYAPYKTQMAAILELSPESINFTDPTLRGAIGPNGEMSIYDFQKALRKDARWQYTNNAREDVFQSVGKVLQDFGFQG